jgi:hypothetical protein
MVAACRGVGAHGHQLTDHGGRPAAPAAALPPPPPPSPSAAPCSDRWGPDTWRRARQSVVRARVVLPPS